MWPAGRMVVLFTSNRAPGKLKILNTTRRTFPGFDCVRRRQPPDRRCSLQETELGKEASLLFRAESFRSIPLHESLPDSEPSEAGIEQLLALKMLSPPSLLHPDIALRRLPGKSDLKAPDRGEPARSVQGSRFPEKAQILSRKDNPHQVVRLVNATSIKRARCHTRAEESQPGYRYAHPERMRLVCQPGCERSLIGKISSRGSHLVHSSPPYSWLQ